MRLIIPTLAGSVALTALDVTARLLRSARCVLNAACPGRLNQKPEYTASCAVVSASAGGFPAL
jgi:hypothetical protein